MSLASAIVRSWRNPRQVLRDLLAEDRHEGRLMLYLSLALFLIFVAQWPRLGREATAEIGRDALLAGALFGIMFVGPLLMYGIAGLLTLILKLRARVEGFAVRLALFWALLASAPLILAQAALAALMGGQGVVVLVSGVAVFALFVAILLAGLRVALEAAQRPA